MPYAETLALEEATKSTREWIEALKRPDETDGTFLVRRYRALTADPMRYAACSAAGFAHAHRRLTWTAWARGIGALLEEAVGQGTLAA